MKPRASSWALAQTTLHMHCSAGACCILQLHAQQPTGSVCLLQLKHAIRAPLLLRLQAAEAVSKVCPDAKIDGSNFPGVCQDG